MYFQQGKSQTWVAHHFGVSRVAAWKWYQAWDAHGDQGLRAKGHPGAPSRLTAKNLEKVRRALWRGPRAQGYATELWTLERMAALIKKTTRVSYHPGHVWKILGHLGWSCQKPETRARERNEKKIKQWVQETFPRIKKRGSGLELS